MTYLEFESERLECRQMLAGDVDVDISGGDLRIRGDGEDNQVDISFGVSEQLGPAFFVSGNEETTINGGSSFIAPVGEVADDFSINLRGGNNRLTFDLSGNIGIGRASIADDLTIRAGGGEDTIILGSVNVGDDMHIRTGGGNDDIEIFMADVTDSVRINTGSGNDAFVVDSLDTDELRISAGGDDDIVSIVSGDYGQLRVNLGGGDDYLFSHDVMALGADLSGGGGDDAWFDCRYDPHDLFAIGNPRSVEASELTAGALFGLRDDLLAGR